MASPRLCSDRIALVVGRLSAAWIALVVVLVLFQTFTPQRSGVFALTQVLEPFIVLTAVVAVPLALLDRTSVAIAIVAVFALVVVGRYGPGFTTGPTDVAATRLTVTAWNVEFGSNGGSRVLAGLDGVTSDVIAFEELQPAMSDALEGDADLAASHPYRALAPDSTVLGVGLISRYPIVDEWYSPTSQPRSSSATPFMRAVIDAPGSPPIAVYVVHPLPGTFDTILHVPVALETGYRDFGIATIREMVDADLAAHMPVVVMGDINTTPREPAYVVLSAGLNDARSAGSWPGLTWRPDPLKQLPFGLLRIDYVLSTALPLDYSVRCTPYSDHCLVSAELGFPAPPA